MYSGKYDIADFDALVDKLDCTRLDVYCKPRLRLGRHLGKNRDTPTERILLISSARIHTHNLTYKFSNDILIGQRKRPTQGGPFLLHDSYDGNAVSETNPR